MATDKQYLSYTGLQTYDGEIKSLIDQKDAANLQAAKDYVDAEVGKVVAGEVEEAKHAISADNATNATNAQFAEQATKDGNGNNIASTYETKNDAGEKLEAAKGYADAAVAEAVKDLASNSAVDNKIAAHNTSEDAHGDIRSSLSDLITQVNNFLDVDDETRDELSEVLALIDANKGTLDSLTSSKVNVADIIDNLTTTATDKPLSANQGKALKDLIDALTLVVNGKAASATTLAGYGITDAYTKTEVDNKLTAKANVSALEALEGTVDGKADKATTLAGYGIGDAYTKTEANNQLKAHTDNTDNPHGVTCVQIGAATTDALASTTSIANEAKEVAAKNATDIAANVQSISAHTTAINANTTAIEGHATRIGALEELEEIPTASITDLFK